MSTIVPADVSSQDIQEVEEDGPTKEPSPPPGSAKEGDDNTEKPSSPTKEPSPPPGSAKEGDDNTEKPSSPATGSSDKGKATDQPAAPQETWEDIFNQRLALHRSRLHRLKRTADKIKEYDGMDFENVVVAVATIWEALRNLGTYAFVGEEQLNPAYSRALKDGIYDSLGVVGGVNGRFIMPLFFQPSQADQEKYYQKEHAKFQLEKLAKLEDKKDGKKDQGPLGHILLAVARRGSPETNQVDIEIRDSLPGLENRNHIEERAQRLAAKWLDIEEVTPNFADVTVISQPYHVNPCGLYTIFNAWAVMLGIPLLGERQRSNHRVKTSREFHERGLEIVNLALAGCMDSRTIQAFLNVYGYSAEQDVQDLPEHRVDAVRMDSDRLKRRLERQKYKDEGFPSLTPSPSSSQGPAHSSSSPELKQALHDSKVLQALADIPGLTQEEAEILVQNLESENEG